MMIYSKRGKTVEKHSHKTWNSQKKIPHVSPKKTGVKENATN